MESEQTVQLHNGILMPVVGLGTWKLQGEVARTAAAHALDYGYKLIDTASAYGNEEVLGEAILNYKKNKPSSSPTDSNHIFVTSKANTSEIGSFDAAYDAFNNTIGRLNLPQIDLYLLHWPGTRTLSTTDPQLRQNRRAAWSALEKLYAEGKVRSIGVSNYHVKHLNELMADGAKIVPMVNQVEMHPLGFYDDILDWARHNQMQVQAYSSFGGAQAGTELLGHPKVVSIANRLNRTPAQVLLRWGIQKGTNVIPCSKTPTNIQTNLDVFHFSLTDDDMTSLCNLNQFKHYCWDPTDVA